MGPLEQYASFYYETIIKKKKGSATDDRIGKTEKHSQTTGCGDIGN